MTTLPAPSAHCGRRDESGTTEPGGAAQRRPWRETGITFSEVIMKTPSVARNDRAFSFPYLLKAAGTSLVALAVTLLVTSCGGCDSAGAYGSAATRDSASSTPANGG